MSKKVNHVIASAALLGVLVSGQGVAQAATSTSEQQPAMNEMSKSMGKDMMQDDMKKDGMMQDDMKKDDMMKSEMKMLPDTGEENHTNIILTAGMLILGAALSILGFKRKNV